MNKIPTLLLLAALSGPALAAGPGEAVFNRLCVACHQAGGEGTPGLAPRLAGALGQRLAQPAGRDYLGQVLLTGLTGRIEAAGETFNGAMPAQAPMLTDQELADVLNHVATGLNAAPAGFKPYGADEMRARRASPASVAATRALRQQSEPAK